MEYSYFSTNQSFYHTVLSSTTLYPTLETSSFEIPFFQTTGRRFPTLPNKVYYIFTWREHYPIANSTNSSFYCNRIQGTGSNI